ncbi:MAG: DUF551 domain-containing protein [Oscillospiraceae bacterium]|nr:DUF551 domain-containing protein [Oscillospiraceae bacterium]
MSDWISTADRLPGTDVEMVLAVVSGKPEKNIILENAYCLAEYAEGEGWILQEWPTWDGAEVTYWMPLPEPPEECLEECL